MTTLKIGGPAEWFAEPRDEEELIACVDACRTAGTPFRLLGRGSNVMVASSGIRGCVLRNTSACTGLSYEGRTVSVGSSVSLQALILESGKRDLGGIEYLYSVPGNVGGAVAMNAGRGRKARLSIADVVQAVEIYDGARRRWIDLKNCRFGYRESIFLMRPDWVILNARLRLRRRSQADVKADVKARSLFVKETQDNRLPNAGTVFREGYSERANLRGRRCGGAAFSERTANWILNDGDASAEDVFRLLDIAADAHAELGLPRPQLEWVVWQ